MEHKSKVLRRNGIEAGQNLVPVTLRIPVQDRDHLEHLARLHGSNLSEYLRVLLNEYGSRVSYQQGLDEIGVQLSAISGRLIGDSAGKPDAGQVTRDNFDEIKDLMSTTTAAVEQCTNLIQGSFEQLFEAFFKLQTFIEQLAKIQVGRL